MTWHAHHLATELVKPLKQGSWVAMCQEYRYKLGMNRVEGWHTSDQLIRTWWTVNENGLTVLRQCITSNNQRARVAHDHIIVYLSSHHCPQRTLSVYTVHTSCMGMHDILVATVHMCMGQGGAGHCTRESCACAGSNVCLMPRLSWLWCKEATGRDRALNWAIAENLAMNFFLDKITSKIFFM
jgi:hypothetical protein